MTRTIATLLVAATALTGTAAFAQGGDNAVAQSRAKLKAEWSKLDRDGAQQDPISALIELLLPSTETAEAETKKKASN